MKTKILRVILLCGLLASILLGANAWAAPVIKTTSLAFPSTVTLDDGTILALDPINLSLDLPETLLAGVQAPFDARADWVSIDGKLPEGYSAVLEWRLDAPALTVDPDGRISQPILGGNSIRFDWDLLAAGEGVYSGTFWVAMNFVPQSGAESAQRVDLFAIPVELTARWVWGMDGAFARGLSIVAGVILAAGFGLTFRKKAPLRGKSR